MEREREREVLIIELEECDKRINSLKERIRCILNDINLFNSGHNNDLYYKYNTVRIKLIAEEKRYIRLLDDLRDTIHKSL